MATQIPTPVVTANPFAKAPALTPVPTINGRGIATSIVGSVKSNLEAAQQRAAAPVASSPFASPAVEAGPPLARPAQPLLAPGTSAFKPQAPITFGTVPGLTAAFSTTPKTTTQAPAVVTADAANDHIDKMTTAANTANSDIQNTAAAKAQLTAAANAAQAKDTPASKTPPAADPAASNPDYDSQISDIISSLGGGTDTTNPANQENQNNVSNVQENEANVLSQENVVDSNLLSTVNDALTSLDNGTMPLTTGEQAQVDNIKNSFIGAIQEAQNYAQNVLGGMAAQDAGGENGGLAMYSPQMAMANIASAIKLGADKIGKVNTDILSAQAQLTKSLQDGDYRTASRLYTQISSGITSRNNEIDKINTSIQNHIDKMQTQALDVAKVQISALTGAATRDATASYRAQQMILSNARLSETQRHDMATELHAADATRTAGERSAQVSSQFGQTFTPGFVFPSGPFKGQTAIDENGYIKPDIWKAAIADAPAEGMSRGDFIKAFGNQIYSDSKKGIDARAYGLTPAEIKIINGALPTN